MFLQESPMARAKQFLISLLSRLFCVAVVCFIVVVVPTSSYSQSFDREFNENYVSNEEFLNNVNNYYLGVLSNNVRVDWFVNRVIEISRSRNLLPKEIRELGTVDDVVAGKLVSSLHQVIFDALLSSSVSKLKGLEELLTFVGSSKLAPNGDLQKHKLQMSEMFATARKAEKFALDNDYKGFVSFIDAVSINDEQAQVVYARFPPVAISYASKLADNDPIGAFIVLAGISKEWRTEELFEVAQKILSGVQVNLSVYSGLGDKVFSFEASDLADEMLVFNPSVSELVARLRSHWVVALIKLGQIQEADEQYSKVIETRRDPNAENNELRFQMVLHAKSKQAKDLAAGRMLELIEAGELTRQRRLRLMLSGYYGYDFLYIGGVFVAIVLSVLVFWRFSFFFLRQLNKVKARIATSKRDNLPGYMKPTTDLDEYSGLLEVLGLDDDASETDIKKAYRERMKELHPDKATSSDITEDERAAEFLKLKRAYERIMEMTEKRFHS